MNKILLCACSTFSFFDSAVDWNSVGFHLFAVENKAAVKVWVCTCLRNKMLDSPWTCLGLAYMGGSIGSLENCQLTIHSRFSLPHIPSICFPLYFWWWPFWVEWRKIIKNIKCIPFMTEIFQWLLKCLLAICMSFENLLLTLLFHF